MAYISNMDSIDYWIERMTDRDNAAKKSEDELINKLYKYNKQAFDEARKELNDFYNKYAINGSLTLQEAQKKLTPIEMEEYKEKMSNLEQLYKITKNNYVFLEMNELKARAYITRQQALLDSINVELIKYSNNVQISMEDHLIGIYRREYESALKDLNISPIPTINTNAIKEIINYPYAGAMFSDRIWRNKKQLLNWINDDLTKHFIKGSSIKSMSNELMDRRNVLKYQAERLVRTETNYAMTQGHLTGYKDAGIEEYEVLAHFDARTSVICQQKDGERIKISNSIVGTNCPPFHPNCRSTVIPVFDDEEIKATTKAASEPINVSDPVLSKLKNLDIINTTNRRQVAKEILKALDLEKIQVSISSIDAHGYCELRIDEDNIQHIGKYVLNSKDLRNDNYKLKTAFHEAFHAKGDNRKSDYNLSVARWTHIEETFAESAAHYAAKVIGVNSEISPSYANHLVKSLPRLKQLDKYKDCNTIFDFGKIAWNDRVNGAAGAEWSELDKQLKAIDHNYITYAVKNKYTDYIKDNKEDLVEVMLENMPQYSNYKKDMVRDIEKALSNIETGSVSLIGNQKMVFENVLAISMNRLGVK